MLARVLAAGTWESLFVLVMHLPALPVEGPVYKGDGWSIIAGFFPWQPQTTNQPLVLLLGFCVSRRCNLEFAM